MNCFELINRWSPNFLPRSGVCQICTIEFQDLIMVDLLCNIRMPPRQLYPLIKGLSQCYIPLSSNTKAIVLDETTSLAVYQKQPVHSDLRKVVRCLKGPFELFPQIILAAEFLVTIESDHGIEQLYWKLTIKEAPRQLHCVLDALGYIHQGLFHSKILLKRVEQIFDEFEKSDTNSSDSKKFSEKEVKKLAKLKENLLKLNKFLDCVLLRYSTLRSQEQPSAVIKSINTASKKINKIINQLNPAKLKDLIPNQRIPVTEEDVLCCILGLNDDFANRLKGLSEEMRQHKTDMYYLLYFLEENDKSSDVENLYDTKEVACALQKMGFTENRSNVVAKRIASQPFAEHRSLLAWAQFYIENLFKYDIFLNHKVSRFPYRKDCLKRWFDVPVDGVEDEDGVASQVSVINTVTEEDAVTCINKKITDFKKLDPKGQLYFHGTDHKSAVNILQNGINLSEGRRRCDFSNGNGFYVADKFECALEYAKKSETPAVILFNMTDDCRKKSLDLTHRRNDLESVRRYFKAGQPRNHGLSRKLFNEIKNCHYIMGPISRDGIESRNWEDAIQICIKKEEMADVVGNPSHIVGIVFLNTA